MQSCLASGINVAASRYGFQALDPPAEIQIVFVLPKYRVKNFRCTGLTKAPAGKEADLAAIEKRLTVWALFLELGSKVRHFGCLSSNS